LPFRSDRADNGKLSELAGVSIANPGESAEALGCRAEPGIRTDKICFQFRCLSLSAMEYRTPTIPAFKLKNNITKLLRK
jgi:hypothetical protein